MDLTSRQVNLTKSSPSDVDGVIYNCYAIVVFVFVADRRLLVILGRTPTVGEVC